ncbi:MAG: gamma carbonic anhydrase family protein [Kordiimonadaceae bacterium]|nr:gamma carbonic anhydrase family protein [Kordiimonadaceae bacterium]
MKSSGHILSYQGVSPDIDGSVFVAPTASVIGNVQIAKEAGVWFGAVLRGDEVSIKIGERTNIQDGVIIHGDEGSDVVIGNDVTIGHNAIVHGCVIKDAALIGMGAVVLDGAVVETGALVAAGAVVTPGKQVAANTLWAGCPAKQIREFEPGETMEDMLESASAYVVQRGTYLSADVAEIK